MEGACADRGLTLRIAGRAALGVVEVGLGGEIAAQASIVSQLRERLPVGEGSVVARRADTALRQMIDPWGDVGDALPLMRRIKQQFDPDGRLNRGRGPGGI